MARLILLFSVALLIGLGGGSGLAVVRAKGAHPAAAPSNSIAAPQAAADSTTTDSTVKRPRDEGSHRQQPAAPAAGADAHASGAKQAHAKPVAAATPNPAEPAQSATRSASQRDSVSPSSKVANALRSEPAGGDRASTPEKTAAESEDLPERRLAKIFGAMRPQEAARVLEQMDDSDVKTILGYLGNRQAAAILGSFPPQRAAVISRLALRSARSTQ